MEVVSRSGKWKYCEVVVDGPNEPPYGGQLHDHPLEICGTSDD